MARFEVSFDSRGAEIVDPVPFEPSTRLGRPPRESLLHQIQRMVLRQKIEAENEIRDEADMMEDQLDFEDNTDSEGLLIPSSYEISDDVPDGFSADAYRKKQAVKKDSPNGGSSVPAEPSGVAGE
nr:hypothetical protein PGBZCLRD_PGBZCLRD_CDS_0006 [Cressdnaviricota sp.]